MTATYFKIYIPPFSWTSHIFHDTPRQLRTENCPAAAQEVANTCKCIGSLERAPDKVAFLGIKVNSWDQSQILCVVLNGLSYRTTYCFLVFSYPSLRAPKDEIHKQINTQQPHFTVIKFHFILYQSFRQIINLFWVWLIFISHIQACCPVLIPTHTPNIRLGLYLSRPQNIRNLRAKTLPHSSL